VFSPPSGPGVRLDAGYTAEMTVPQAYDSLIGKLIVTGATRREALQRAARALAEFEVGGMPTVLPFHRAVVTDPAFTAEDGSLRVHTRWIETEFSASLPGTIIKIAVADGQQVQAGDVVVVLEAMKMEQPLNLPFNLPLSRWALRVSSRLTVLPTS
jgi:acetyl-CoA/propionyl-CoA carboxylase biotin carboxyl carrier protein